METTDTQRLSATGATGAASTASGRISATGATGAASTASGRISATGATGAASTASGRVPREWWEEFEAARQRPLPLRFRYAFIHTYKPVLDDAPYRSFATLEAYRRWCEQHLPGWLGYARV